MGKVFVGPRVSDLDTNAKPARVSRVNLIVDGENMYTAGDDTGRTIEKTCPWGTQAMADSILSRLRKVDYQPFSGTDGLLDPAAELGDGITVGDVYSVLAKEDITFDGLYTVDIAAPGGDEVEDEYPYKSRSQRQQARETARIYSSITKTSDRITLLVKNKVDGLEGKLELTSQSFTTQISAANQRISSIQQYVDNIELKVVNGSTSSRITLTSGDVTIASQDICMTGLVTFTGLQNGTTTINGGCIRTGTIDAQYLNLSGAIRFEDLSLSMRNEINDISAMASDAQSSVWQLDNTVSAWTYGSSTYIDGSKIMTGTVKASMLQGGRVDLLASNESIIGSLTIAYTSSGYGLGISTDYGGIRIASAGNFWVDATYGSMGITESGLVSRADCVPWNSGNFSLGAPGLSWSDVYASNGSIVTSDLAKKLDVSRDLNAYDKLFSALQPISYRLKDGTSGRRHLGLGAQDVERAMRDAGIDSMDFAGFIKSPRDDGGFDYALRYSEFIALCIRQIQKLTARVAGLERRLAS